MARRKKLPTEPFEAEITALLENGRGACVHNDNPLQAHGGLPGERVPARYLFGRRMRGQAEVLEVLEPSAGRIAPRCPHFGTCSACTLQHMDLDAQLAFKQRILLDHLAGEGRVGPEDVLPPLRGETWNYRRKARLSVRHVKAKGRVLVGFRERDGRFVADITECHILRPGVAARLPGLAELIASMDAFESIPQIEVTCGDEECALIFRHLEALSEEDLARLRGFSSDTGLAVLLQPKGPDSVMALEPPGPDLRYALPEYDLEYCFEPLDFIQVNGGLNRLMIRQALALLQLQSQERVLDLFCGLGNFTLPLARHCAEAVGIEGDAGLVKRARQNARRNDIENAAFHASDLYAGAAEQSWAGASFDKVLLDPPRSGAEDILPLIESTGAGSILYVSCNPATLARDAGILVGRHGFRLQAAGVMDMFPHTTHVESMALFRRS